MKSYFLSFTTAFFLLPNFHTSAAVRHVDVSSTNPTPPYTSWATAAATIQEAVDAAVAGDQILVTNGVYGIGGQVAYGAMTNRVAVTKAVTVQSVNGPTVTAIHGYQVPGATNGDSAVRCVYLADGASLIGFTLTNGATRTSGTWNLEQSGGGVLCASTNSIVSDCAIIGNSARDSGGGVIGGTLNNCTLSGNSAFSVGGGAYGSLLNNCTVSDNFAADGGGGVYSSSSYAEYRSVLNNCTLTGNFTLDAGGGAYRGTLNNCTLSDNSASGGDSYDGMGGGTYGSTLYNCVLTNNSANYGGGGAYGGTLNNCALIANTAGMYGGGAANATLNNCTLTGNSASQGGGTAQCSLYNCINYYNSAAIGANQIYSYMTYCCITPTPGPESSGGGNISSEPQLADAFHLNAASPCRNAGSATYATGLDMDGEPWVNPPSIGCDEYNSGAITGSLAVAIQASYTNVAAGFAVDFAATISGHAAASRWDFGGGIVVSNRTFFSHRWETLGDHIVTLTVYNESNPGGVSATVTVHVVEAPVHYVSINNASPVAPFTSWATAAGNIQDAINASSLPGALVLVSNGVYNVGGTVAYGNMTNRVAVIKPVTVQSVNGSAATVIEGNPTLNSSAVRCVYLTNGAALKGFTVTRGSTINSGDETREMTGAGIWCPSASAFVSDCLIVSNSAYWDGGGAVGGTLSNCTFIGNIADDGGGGAAGSTLNNCALTNNSATSGGGVWVGTANGCILIGNVSTGFGSTYGGGASDSLINNSVVTKNFAAGTRNCVVNNSTLIQNSGGGAVYGALNNSIVYYNTGINGELNNYSADSILNYCCTTPLPASGVGNTSAEPQLADLYHLSGGSPCRAAGSGVFSSGLDIDGEPWLNLPSIGCDEYYSGATGPLSVDIQVALTNVAKGFAVNFTAQIVGHASFHRWDFGDGTVVSNQLVASHSWTAAGDYLVTLTAYNDSNPGGASATILIHVFEGAYYVAVNNANPLSPYTSWATAATNIQDAVNAAVPGGTILVSNGVFQVGGTFASGISNRVAVTKPLTVQSVNGPTSALIVGGNAMRCVYLTNGAALNGFTLTNGNSGGVAGASTLAVVSNCVIVGVSGVGASYCTLNSCTLSNNSAYTGGGAFRCTLNNCLIKNNQCNGEYGDGGGAFQCTVNNCILIGNSAIGRVGGGGGASGGTLNNCLVISNSANYAGGVEGSTARNCTIVGNSALGTAQSWGGGAGNSTLYNCILYYNNAPNVPNRGYSTTLNYCCTPLPEDGVGNITNAPAFLNQAAGDFHLQTNSACINAGNNADASGNTDLDGNLRIMGGMVDIGAYEASSVSEFTLWLQQYGLATDGSADFTDPDGDGMNNWQEWRCGTDPTNALSLLRLVSAVAVPTGLALSWQSISNKVYFIEQADDLGAQPAFLLLKTNIAGQFGTTTYIDTNAVSAGPIFYRVGVQ